MADLTRRQERGIIALLGAHTVEAAADASNIPVRTLFKWLSEDGFRTEYRATSRRALDRTVGRLRHASSEALATLEELLSDDSPTVRYQAAAKILELGVRVETDELAQRVDALEEAHAA